MMGCALYINRFSAPSQHDYKVVKKTFDRLLLGNLSDRFYDELSSDEQ